MRAVQAAALARAEAVWNAAQVHEVGGVPDSPTSPYLVVGASAAAHPATRGGSVSGGSSRHRLTVQAVGRDMAEVTFAVEKIEAAFVDHRLAVAGYDTTPCHSEVVSPVIRDPDGGAFLVCTLSFTFAASPA